MNTKIITEMEEALFGLHPEVQSFYRVINFIKELPLEDPDLNIKVVTHGNIEQVLTPKIEASVIVNTPPITYSPREHSLQIRVLNIIKELNRFVRVGEIIDKIKEYDPNFCATISSVLTQLRVTGILKNYMPTGNRKITYWGLTEWEWEGKN